MALTNYEPWGLLDRFNQQLNQLGYSDKSLSSNDNDFSNVVTSHWRPAVDIKEEADRFLITADLPGVDPKDIEITMDNGILTIKGERESEVRDEKEGYKRVERVSGTFYRRFSLPDTADAERIEAKGKDGVLEVILPKHEKVQPRKIEVKS
ncbi:MAG: Hsp20/alpha crystallin family protein [Proteobacteria bacterium]|nr:Hsp20/alpha crystallin family protein [Pseudomonadota bacterium]NOG59900.1 Hsp20/alpha crystallin family protein [Pseudomonadota bacterium]